jgi:hypothetical protein
MTRDAVEAVVACHDPARPLERVVGSVLRQSDALAALGADLQVTVVCHNREIEDIAGTLSPTVRERIRFLHLADGIYSPAGPINLGLRSSEATWVTTIGSDDTLADGALPAWYRRGRDTGADAVLAPILRTFGTVETPLMRPGRRATLHPIRDHLAYRTAPLGLLRVETMRRIGFAYTEARLVAGSDIEPGMRMWFRGGRITYPYGAPGYLVSDDMGASRVTSTLGTAARELGWLPHLLGQDWLRSAAAAEREEIATCIVRSRLLAVVRRRAERASSSGPEIWGPEDATTMATARDGLAELVGAPLHGLSRGETRLLADAAAATDGDGLVRAWATFDRGPGRDRALTNRPLDNLRSTARLRTSVEHVLARSTGSYAHPVGDARP